jgi:uncharacterized protein YllA (UPF0747 family)
MSGVDDTHDLNGLDARISTRGYFERILHERDALEEERDRRLEERYENQKEALAAALVSAEKANFDLQNQIDALKDFQGKLIALAMSTPVVTAIIVYLLTR